MKKALFFLVCLILVCSFCSCRKNPGEHTHDFCERVEDEGFLATPSSCSSPASYYLSCSCGAMTDKIFLSGNPLSHEYENGECIHCGKKNPDTFVSPDGSDGPIELPVIPYG